MESNAWRISDSAILFDRFRKCYAKRITECKAMESDSMYKYNWQSRERRVESNAFSAQWIYRINGKIYPLFMLLEPMNFMKVDMKSKKRGLSFLCDCVRVYRRFSRMQHNIYNVQYIICIWVAVNNNFNTWQEKREIKLQKSESNVKATERTYFSNKISHFSVVLPLYNQMCVSRILHTSNTWYTSMAHISLASKVWLQQKKNVWNGVNTYEREQIIKL